MRNLLKVAALLLALVPFSAQATVVGPTTADQRLEAAAEVTAVLSVPANTEITIFVSGVYAAGNTVLLERQVGSPGGTPAWETIMTVTTATANARIVQHWTSGTGPEAFRLRMSATGTGEVSAFLTDHPRVARKWVTNADQIVWFDDFSITGDASATAFDAGVYLATEGSTAAGDLPVITTAIQEGGVTFVSGGTDVTDGECLSSITTAAFGALPSEGWTAFEVRLRHAEVDGFTGMMLTSVECQSPYVVLVDYDASSYVVLQDAIGIGRDDEADDANDWQAFSSLVTAEGANEQEVVLGIETAINTYVVLRVEIDQSGNGYFYIDGVLLHAEPLAVTPGTRMIPLVETHETAAGGGPTTMVLDYWMFVVPRPKT